MTLQEIMEGREAETLRAIYPRVSREFWANVHSFVDDPRDIKAIENSEEDMFFMLDEFLRNEHDITVRGDGNIEVVHLNKFARKAIGDLPIVLFHYTSSGVVDRIRKEGLVPGDTNVNRQFIKKSSGVYLTTEASGPVVKGYLHGARHAHGGEPVRVSVRTYIKDLMRDPDDEGLRSGDFQYVVPYIDPDDILEIEEYDPW